MIFLLADLQVEKSYKIKMICLLADSCLEKNIFKLKYFSRYCKEKNLSKQVYSNIKKMFLFPGLLLFIVINSLAYSYEVALFARRLIKQITVLVVWPCKLHGSCRY